MKKFKVNDTIIITSGKDKGKKGKITRVYPSRQKVVVEGVGLYKKHLKPQQTGGKGKIIDRQRPIPTANIAHLDPKNNQPTRAKFIVDQGGQKQRVSVSTNMPLPISEKKK
ncbi:MAG: 50S ribosomal protein L24 [Candidatus Chisholmbacteria bacterium]|nr:50S ribosomal protein L24 [Candidatus Chisholmbacteria bacterium]